MKKVLITGASGFVGKYLVDLLSQNKENQIFGTYLNHEDKELSKKAKLFQVDLSYEDRVGDLISKTTPDVIFHLAAVSSPKDSFNDPKKTFENNVSSEINLFEAVRSKFLLKTKIIIISSAEIYGFVSKENLPINENTPMNPTSPYAVSKIAQDYLALQYFNSYEMNIVRIRPFNHFGPGQSPNFVVSSCAKKIAQIEKGLLSKLTTGNLDSRRDFTDVRDVVKAYKLAWDKAEAGEAYNIGTGKSYKISEILDKLIFLSNVGIKVETDTSLLMPFDNPDLVCNYSKFNKATGWTPQIPLEQTLKETLDYWRSVV